MTELFEERQRTAYALSVLSIILIVVSAFGHVFGQKIHNLANPPVVSPETTAVCCPECWRREAEFQDSLDLRMRGRP